MTGRYVTNRGFADGRTQVLTWDAPGRRVRSEYWPRGTNSADAVTVKSWFDPEVEEFL